MSAINLATGDYAWQLPLGSDSTRQAKGAPDTGQEGKAGPIVTAGGLIFISGTEDKKLRAFNKTSGKLLWQTTLPALLPHSTCPTKVDRNSGSVGISISSALANNRSAKKLD